ncbi:MAG TPA: PEGA domain-containing protein [Myxococcota bacterium]|nr:PEGA domain-containing protein [Myxococcota bacterium]HRY94166.1 PEGA domain-containing protein [Myxococcota bacterium]HSA23187.1 PEGA domain-containing protein [Myxococcota bacterium]
MRAPRWSSFCVWVVLCAAAPAAAQERATVAKLAVLDLGDKGVGTDLVALMSASVARQLSSYGVFEVITRADVGKMLLHVQDKLSAGCSSPDCLVQVGDVLGAEKLVAGEVGLVGKRYLISLQRMDVKKGVVENRVQREFEGPLEKIREEVRLATHQLVEDLLKLESGTLLLQVSEEGADVSLDGTVVGTSPLKGLSVPAGPHEVRVSKQGFVAWARTLQMRPRSTEALEARLIPSAEFIQAYEDKAFSMRRWAWISFATFAVLEGAALGLRLYTWQKYDPIEADYEDLVDPAERYQFYQDHVDQIRLAEKLDYAALGSALVGVVLGGVSLYLFLEGEDPDRYELFREASVAPQVGLSPLPGGANLSLGWSF